MSPNSGVAPASPFTGAGPITGPSWAGIFDTSVAPPDPNGAIGPSSYVEIINDKFAIYRRNGAVIQAATMATLTGDPGPLSDPMVLWDANTSASTTTAGTSPQPTVLTRWTGLQQEQQSHRDFRELLQLQDELRLYGPRHRSSAKRRAS